MIPRNWRKERFPEDEEDDMYYTNEGCEYSNSIWLQHGLALAKLDLPSFVLDSLEIKDVSRYHPAYPGRGCFARCSIEQGHILGVYSGILRPGMSAKDNAYVFAVANGVHDLVIDAEMKGNILRFINDPRKTGRQANVWAYDGVFDVKAKTVELEEADMTTLSEERIPVVVLTTKQAVEAGEELLCDYECSQKGYWTNSSQKESVDVSNSQTNMALRELRKMAAICKSQAISFQQNARSLVELLESETDSVRKWKTEKGIDQLERFDFRLFQFFCVYFHSFSLELDHLVELIDLLDKDYEDRSMSISQPMEFSEEEREEEVEEIPWIMLTGPNGVWDSRGTRVSKAKGVSSGWNCECRGSKGWRNGVHEWSLSLPEGGSGVNIGVCCEDIDHTNGKRNREKCLYVHCATGSGTCPNAKPRVFNAAVNPGQTVSVRLDMNTREVTFGLDGEWNGRPTFTNIEDRSWFPYVALYYPKTVKKQ